MHTQNLEKWKCVIDPAEQNSGAEKRTWYVIALTLFMMIAEISGGMIFGSMALLADGWHMGTHAAALGISAFAYWYARRQKENPRFTFGTGKVSVIGGYTSSTVLIMVALMMIYESVERFFSPVEIHFNQAIIVAAIGLVVNIVSALMLKDDHQHGYHDHHDHHDYHKHHAHQDHNLRAAYMHVIADALTSVMAIIALTAGKYLGWVWLDPIIGIVGAFVIIRWGYGLLKDTSNILLDSDVGPPTYAEIRKILEADSDNRVADFHLFKIGSERMVGLISIVTHYPRPPQHYKSLLKGFPNLAHVTIEVIAYEGESCVPDTKPI
jgi:cation diffusion facilitator family transporter